MNSNDLTRNVLGPDELRLAGEAFERALAEVGESELHPYAIRKSLAQHVMQEIFAGERNSVRLCRGALAALRQLEGKERAHGLRAVPASSNENIRPLSLAKA